MDSRLLLRAAAAVPRPFCHQTALASRLSRPALATLPSSTPATQQRRTKATTNRTKRALNIPPHPSFLGRNTDASGNELGEDVVIFNPPSSEASVYHTPFKFLPQSDPRRRANMAALFESSATIKYPEGAQEAADGTITTASRVQPKHMPTVNMSPKKDKLTAEDVAEMRRLRDENPIENSVTKLAKRFNCTKAYVMIATGHKDMTDHKKRMERQLDKLKARWGPRKAKARSDRYKRTEMLYRGELQ